MSRYVSLCLDMSQRPPIKRYSALNIVLHLNGTMNLADKRTLNLVRFGTTKPNFFQRFIGSIGLVQPFIRDINAYYPATFTYREASKTDLVSEGYMKNVTVYAVIKAISTVAAMAPWGIYRVKDRRKFERYKALQTQPYSTKQVFELQKAKSDALEPDTSHYLNRILESPNPQQGMSEYHENLIGFRLLTGDGYEWANMGEVTKRIAELRVLPSQDMKILTEPPGTHPMNEEGYIMQFGTQQIPFTKEEVNHFKYWNPAYDGSGSHLYGMSPLDAAYLNILQDNSAREAAVELLKNRGPRGIFTIESDKITDYGHFKEIKGDMSEDFNQRKKEYKDTVMPVFGHGQWHNVGLSAKELAIIDICQMNKDDICNAYGISTILLNNHDASTDNNYSHARKELITRAVLPELIALRDSRNKKLASGDWGSKNEGIVFDFDQTIYTELDDDKKAIAEWMKLAACFDDDEIRVQLGYEPKGAPHSKEVWKKTNDIPASMIDRETITKMPNRNEQAI